MCCLILRALGFQVKINGGLAQLGERLPCKQEVTGSIPVISTIPLKEDSQNRL